VLFCRPLGAGSFPTCTRRRLHSYAASRLKTWHLTPPQFPVLSSHKDSAVPGFHISPPRGRVRTGHYFNCDSALAMRNLQLQTKCRFLGPESLRNDMILFAGGLANSFAPSRLANFSLHPRLTPWALFCHRFAAGLPPFHG